MRKEINKKNRLMKNTLMKKKAQITWYILASVVVVFALGFLLYARNIGNELPEGPGGSIDLSVKKASLESKINFCIEQKTKEAIDIFGLENSQDLIKNHIESQLDDCIDFEVFEEHGLNIKHSGMIASIDINEKLILVDVYYPITITAENLHQELSRFSFRMSLMEQASISLTSDGRLKEQIVIVTEDGDSELIIPVGTRMTDEEGNILDARSIELKILDKRFNGMENDVVAGMVVYNILPDGARFDPAAKLTIKYRDESIPPETAEQRMNIAWFDEEYKTWIAIPSSIDTESNTITADIIHLTPYTVIGEEPITFTAIGSTHSGIDSQYTDTFLLWGDANHKDAVAEMAKLQPDLYLHLGDMIDSAYQETTKPEEWDQFFETEKPIMDIARIYPAIGNHEMYFSGDHTYFNRFKGEEHLVDFLTDENKPRYSFDAGYAHFTSLWLDYDAVFTPEGEDVINSEQYAWLEDDLKNTQKPWKIVMVHISLYSASAVQEDYGYGLEEVREKLQELFTEYKVDLVLSGHDHYYERVEINGVTYITTGGGCNLHPEPEEKIEQSQKFVHRNHIMKFDVDEATLTGTAISSHAIGKDWEEQGGEELDTFTLTKED